RKRTPSSRKPTTATTTAPAASGIASGEKASGPIAPRPNSNTPKLTAAYSRPTATSHSSQFRASICEPSGKAQLEGQWPGPGATSNLDPTDVGSGPTQRGVRRGPF